MVYSILVNSYLKYGNPEKEPKITCWDDLQPINAHLPNSGLFTPAFDKGILKAAWNWPKNGILGLVAQIVSLTCLFKNPPALFRFGLV